MPAKLSVYQQEALIKLRKQGWTISKAAAFLGIDRGTAAHYLKLHAKEEAIKLTPAASLSVQEVAVVRDLIAAAPQLVTDSQNSQEHGRIRKVLASHLRDSAAPMLDQRELKLVRANLLTSSPLTQDEVDAVRDLVPHIPTLIALAGSAVQVTCGKCRASVMHLRTPQVICWKCGATLGIAIRK